MAIDWTGICREYKGLWIGIKDDQKTVVASGKTVDEVMKKSEKRGFKQPILFKVPASFIPYVG